MLQGTWTSLESKPPREAENANVTHKSIPRIRYTGSPIAHQTPTKPT